MSRNRTPGLGKSGTVRISDLMSKSCVTSPSLDDLVRAYQKRLRNRESECLGCLEIDYECESLWLLDRQVCRLGPLENLVGIRSESLRRRVDLARIAHEATISGTP